MTQKVFVLYTRLSEILEAVAKLEQQGLKQEDIRIILKEFLKMISSDVFLAQIRNKMREEIEQGKVVNLRELIIKELERKLLYQ